MQELDTLRSLGMRALVAVCWACVAIVLGGSLFSAAGLLPVVMALAITALPTMMIAQGRSDATARLVLGATMPLYPAILLYQWSGSAWMIDLHMTFFAVIAMTAGLADWRPVLAAAAVTAVHHLVLNFAAPALVFSGTGNVPRVLLHAVVVVAETAVLAALAIKLERGMVEQAQTQAEAERVRQRADAERDAREAEQRMVVDQIGAGLDALAKGDLSHRMTGVFPAAFGQLRDDFNAALADLEQLVGNVADASSHIQAGAAEIRTASDDLARRTERQAGSVEQASTTLNRLVDAATDTAQNAATVNTALASAQDSATAGQDVVNRAMATMERVEKSASEIRQIIGLIDGIAFQTNLLALNAGVEAARAGESGKGFAVVANEVRALAQRSADAANGIKALIDTSTTEVAEAVSQVVQTGEALNVIQTQVIEIGMAVDGIAYAANGNASDLRDVNGTFDELDRATQQNAAMVEESTAALRALSDATDGLMHVISRFRRSGQDVGNRLAGLGGNKSGWGMAA
ncbi:MAG TPA: methyl-accepting chemotaxis protein [Novosphingobium sp.]|nr:methyl-accepting chemotaxis protein [Novosphingobium sp.]